MTLVTDKLYNDDGILWDLTVVYTYGENNYVIKTEASNALSDSQTVREYFYNDNNQVTHITSTHNNSSSTTTYLYNDQGLIIERQILESSEPAFLYTYNEYDQLIQINDDTYFNYDDTVSDNYTTKTYTLPVNEIISYTYDNQINPYALVFPSALSKITNECTTNNLLTEEPFSKLIGYEYNLDGYPTKSVFTYVDDSPYSLNTAQEREYFYD